MGRGSHSHGVGGDRVQDDLWGSGWRLRHHIWQQERGVRDLWGHPGGLNPTLHPQVPSSDTLSRAGGHTGPPNPAASMGSEEKSHPSTTSMAQIQGFGGLAMHPSPPGETSAPKEKLPESLTWENELLLVLVVMGGCKRGTRVQHWPVELEKLQPVPSSSPGNLNPSCVNLSCVIQPLPLPYPHMEYSMFQNGT